MKKLSFLFIALASLLVSCSNVKPEKAEPVTNFEVNKYLGTWYEIARFDFKFEKDLNNTSAQLIYK